MGLTCNGDSPAAEFIPTREIPVNDLMMGYVMERLTSYQVHSDAEAGQWNQLHGENTTERLTSCGVHVEEVK
jgi:hypothetical protein